jgi:hypothetical protein
MRWRVFGIGAVAACAAAVIWLGAWGRAPGVSAASAAERRDRAVDEALLASVARRVEAGQKTFRFDTFGDEAFWGGVLRLHEAIEGSAHGGVGPGVSPRTALAVGLKIDVDALPPEVVAALKAGKVNLDDPDVTLLLLKANAVVGVTGFPDDRGGLRSIGIQCALCHSRVDDSLAPGIGHRLDGWPAEDLNVGAIVGLSPDLSSPRCSASTRRRSATCSRAGARGGSTRSSSSTARRSGPTARPPRRSSRPRTASPA